MGRGANQFIIISDSTHVRYLLELLRRVLERRAREAARILAAFRVGGEAIAVAVALFLLLAVLSSLMSVVERLTALLKP